jgi:chromosome segregation ATPase
MQAFIDQVQRLLDKGQKLRDRIQKVQDELNDQDSRLKDIVQPVQELKEREVSTMEIVGVRDALLHMLDELQADFDELGNLDEEMDRLAQEVDDLINKGNMSRLEDADRARKELDAYLDDLQDKRDDLAKKLQEYKDLIADGKKTCRQDPEMVTKLNKLEQEAGDITRELSDVDKKYADLKTRRAEVKAFIDDLKRSPEKATPANIDQVLGTIEDLKGMADGVITKVSAMDDDVEERIRALKELLAKYREAKNLQFTADELAQQMAKDFADLRKGLDGLPPKIKILKSTLHEMERGTGPDQYADYYDERQTIRKNLDSLDTAEADLV